MKAEFEYHSKQWIDLINRVVASKMIFNEAHLLVQSRILKTVAYSNACHIFDQKTMQTTQPYNEQSDVKQISAEQKNAKGSDS